MNGPKASAAMRNDRQRAGRRSRLRVNPILAVVLVALFSAGVVPGSPAHGGSTAAVLAIDQTSYVTEPGTFTVSVEVSAPASVSSAYFTFCQLSSPLCYLPVSMTLHGGNWLVGTTKPMNQYGGMTVGVSAGYNITILYKDNSTLTEPSIPNAFSNLSIAQSVTGEYMFAMTVRPQLFAVSGAVTDVATGAPIVGATVKLAPGANSTTTSATGTYSFIGLLNGSYTVTVSEKGYANASKVVQLSGQNATQNLELQNSSAPPQTGNPKSDSSGGMFSLSSVTSSPVALGLIALVVVVVALVGYSVLRRRGGGSPPVSPGASPEAPGPK